MKLIDVINNENRDEFVKHNYNLPRYEIKKLRNCIMTINQRKIR